MLLFVKISPSRRAANILRALFWFSSPGTMLSLESFALPGDENKHGMLEYGKIRFHYSCSIGLYVSNLMGKVVPEGHFQKPDENHGTRRLTPDRIAFDAFGRCIKTEPNQAKRSLISDPGHIYPIGVMY